MPSARFALTLFTAACLNGSVVLAMTQPDCAAPAHRVCALPLDGGLQQVNLPRTPIRAPDTPGGWAADLAPPARPVDLHIRHARAAEVQTAAGADDAPQVAGVAPPRRPADLRRWPAPAL